MADLGREGCPKVGTTRNKAAPKVRGDRHLFHGSPKVGIFFCGIDVRAWPATPFLHAPLTRVGLLQDGLCRIVGAEGDEIDTVDFD